jgi:O-glycosyl hydrolase
MKVDTEKSSSLGFQQEIVEVSKHGSTDIVLSGLVCYIWWNMSLNIDVFSNLFVTKTKDNKEHRQSRHKTCQQYPSTHISI